MFKKLSIISFAFFILSGHFSNFLFFSELPFDISFISMIIPVLYFIYWSLKTFSLHKTLFYFIFFLFTLIPSIFFMNGSNNKTYMFLMIFFVLTIISPILLNSNKSIRIFINTLLITSVSIIFISILKLDNIHEPTGRIILDSGNPIWLARAVSISILILLVFFYYKKIKMSFFIILFVSGLFIMFSTGSKGPIVALFITLVFINIDKFKVFLFNKRFIVINISIIIFTLVVALITYIFFPRPFLRLVNVISSESTNERLYLYQDALNIIKNNFFGVGLGNFEKHSFFKYPHNLILESFAELGWISGITLMFLIILSFIGLKKFSKESIYGEIIFGLFILSFINSMMSGDLTSPKELYLLLPIGLSKIRFSFIQSEMSVLKVI